MKRLESYFMTPIFFFLEGQTGKSRNSESVHIRKHLRNVQTMLNLFGGVYRKIDQTVGVSPFIIVPGDDLVEVVVEADAC